MKDRIKYIVFVEVLTVFIFLCLFIVFKLTNTECSIIDLPIGMILIFLIILIGFVAEKIFFWWMK